MPLLGGQHTHSEDCVPFLRIAPHFESSTLIRGQSTNVKDIYPIYKRGHHPLHFLLAPPIHEAPHHQSVSPLIFKGVKLIYLFGKKLWQWRSSNWPSIFAVPNTTLRRSTSSTLQIRQCIILKVNRVAIHHRASTYKTL